MHEQQISDANNDRHAKGGAFPQHTRWRWLVAGSELCITGRRATSQV